MDADPAAANHINRLEHTSPNGLATQLPLLFEKILDPDQGPRFTYSYVLAIRKVFSRERQGVVYTEFAGNGFSQFGRAALDAGLVPTMKSVIAMADQDSYSVLSTYYGIETLTRLYKTATLEQKRSLSRQLLEHDVLPILYDRLESHPYFVVRIVAANLITMIARESDYFSVHPDAAVTAEMIFRCCRASLVGPGQAEEEMGDPSRRWTTCYLWDGNSKMTVREAVKYAPRGYNEVQENLFLSVADLVSSLPARKKTSVLEMLRKRPQILRHTLMASCEARTPWYPETRAYSFAAESFASLVNLPVDRVPGVSVSIRGDLQQEIDEEWAASLEILQMVTTIPGWVNKVYAVWDRIESEPWMAILALLNRLYQQDIWRNANTLFHIMRDRGASRLSVLRAVISLTYIPESLPDFFIFTFLRVAYACSRARTPAEDITPSQASVNDFFQSLERADRVSRKPFWVVVGVNPIGADYSLVLYEEEYSGPIAFLRLILLLSERGLLSKIPSWSSIPSYYGDAVEPGIRRPTLPQTKHLTSPTVIQRFVSTSLKRVTELREVHGRKDVEGGNLNDARWHYACGSELSAAVVAFLESPEAETELKSEFLDEAKKELVLCLGNGAEALIRATKHLEALKFASAAVAIGARCPGLTEAVMTKNKNRYNTAMNAVH